MIIVNPNGHGDVLTIQEAIDAAPDGETILVFGEHTEDLPLDTRGKRFELRGGVFPIQEDEQS